MGYARSPPSLPSDKLWRCRRGASLPLHECYQQYLARYSNQNRGLFWRSSISCFALVGQQTNRVSLRMLVNNVMG